MGWFGVLVTASVAGWALVTAPTRSVGLVLFMVALGALFWVALIRPGVQARDRGLVLRNMLKDIHVPWGRIESCEARQTLQVRTDDALSYHGLGVSRSTRSIVRGNKTGGLSSGGFGFGPADVTPIGEEAAGQSSYQEYVSSRIMNLARDRSRATAGQPVRTAYAREAVAVSVIGLGAFVVGLARVLL